MPYTITPPSTKKTGYALAIVSTAVATATCAFLLDPRAGRKRRAVLRDKSAHALRGFADAMSTAIVDAQHRGRGLFLRTAGLFVRDAADSETLESRVRARLGRVCSHPRAITVTAEDNGTVRLKGDVLERELPGLIGGVRAVRGVRDVLNDLTVHRDASHVPHLQGGRDPSARSAYLRQTWAPAPRFFTGVTGIGLIAGGLARGSAGGIVSALGGALLLGRSLSETPLPRRTPKRGVQIDKTIRIYAEPQEVYALWRDPQRFPQFMSHVKSVRKIGDKLYHWKVTGPAGVPVEWNAEITGDIPGQLISWRTMEGAPVQSSGVVQFEPDPFGGTHLHIRMSYSPPADQLGHALAKVFGADPKHQLDEDMLRFKSLVEMGKTRTDEGAVIRH